MRALRIFAFARTNRCAMVGSGTRNARATSAVDSPPSRRSVSATRAGSASAGWQQVKISRSWSSGSSSAASTASSGVCVGCGTRRAAAARRSAPVVSRRNRSIARLRAVVMIQPAGLGGMPSLGQQRTAAANASATASSATSRSPVTRASTATARPCSARKIRAIASVLTR